eukprot:7116867-Heterocapsa_arctica.AAC.1
MRWWAEDVDLAMVPVLDIAEGECSLRAVLDGRHELPAVQLGVRSIRKGCEECAASSTEDCFVRPRVAGLVAWPSVVDGGL